MLRQEVLSKREALTRSEVEEKSLAAARQVLNLPQYLKAWTLLVYLPFRNEMDTMMIIETAWQQQKKVLVPVCRPHDKSLVLSQLASLDELAPGTWGIPEPKAGCLRPLPGSCVDLALLPGVAFDSRGQRLGYGGGYFDRFLPSLRPDCPRLALAYDFQILDSLPAERHDEPVDIIVTESRVIYPDPSRIFSGT